MRTASTVTAVARVLMLCLMYLQLSASSSDAACGSSLDQFPCPPAFPDWVALFPKTIAAFGTSEVAQLQNDAVTLAKENNVSISFCIEKVKLTIQLKSFVFICMGPGRIDNTRLRSFRLDNFMISRHSLLVHLFIYYENRTK